MCGGDVGVWEGVEPKDEARDIAGGVWGAAEDVPRPAQTKHTVAPLLDRSTKRQESGGGRGVLPFELASWQPSSLVSRATREKQNS